MRPQLVALLLSGLTLLSAAEAMGGEEYRELIKEAVQEYGAGRYQEALTLFHKAYALQPGGKVLRGMAKAQFELRQYARAVETIDRALQATEAPLDEAMGEEMRGLRERASQHVGSLSIDVAPRDAEVWVDGQPLEPTSGAGVILLDAGDHAIAARHPERRPAHRSVTIEGGQTLELSLRLDPVASKAPAGPPPVTSRTDPDSAPPPQRSAQHAPLYVSGALGLVGIGGVVASVVWLLDRDAAVDDCAQAAGLGARCDNADSIATQRDAAVWLLAGSAAVTAGAAIAFGILLGDLSDPAAVEPGVACGPLAGGGLCTATLRW